MSQQDGKTEGWLYLIRSNRFGLQYSRRRYFVLEADTLSCFKSMPVSGNENPRTAVIDSCIRVTDNGRESIKRNVFFIFTLYNSSNHNDQLKLGARSSEEAASWIRSLMEAALKGQQSSAENGVSFSKPRWQPFRFSHKRRSQTDSVDWTLFPPINSDPVTSDVIAPSPWTIFGCQNGLRLFKEAKDGDVNMKRWSDHPAIMAVGVVAATSEAIFRTIMSLGPSRSEWDFCFYKGEVIEHLDGHTDIIHKKLKLDWLPWGMRPRDLLLQRYWRREDDGTYVILYHSVFHESCRLENGYVRACLKSGGYVITPVNQGRQSVVKHMLAIDWKSWKSFLFPSSAKCVTVRMLGRVAALRELFKANRGNLSCPDSSSGELMREISVHIDKEPTMENGVQSVEEATKSEDSKEEPGTAKTMNSSGSFVELNDAGDEFFDVPEQSDIGYLETEWPSHACVSSQDGRQTKLSSAAGFVKMLQFATQKRGYIDLQEPPVGDTTPCIYGATLPKDGTCNMLCSCTTAEPSTFLIRGETYLQDRHKIKANGTLMQMVGADWLKSDKREDDLAGRHSSIVQKYTSQGGKEFFFIINIQVPGSTTYSLAFYYMMDVPLQNVPLFERFVNGDDAFRNSRFKLIPYISKGSWIVKQSVGKKACLVGQALEIHYFRGKNYLELGIDIGSSTVARGVVSLVLGYLNNLVIEMAFVIQGNSDEELPEFLLGTCRLNHLDATKAVPVH